VDINPNKEPEEIVAAANFVVPSGFHGEVRTHTVEEAHEEVIAVQAANTETSAAVKPLKSVSGLVNFFKKKHMAVLQNPGVKSTMTTPPGPLTPGGSMRFYDRICIPHVQTIRLSPKQTF
jgi:hypothetical protein